MMLATTIDLLDKLRAKGQMPTPYEMEQALKDLKEYQEKEFAGPLAGYLRGMG